MPSSYIFLDLEGVLLNKKSSMREDYPEPESLDPECVKALRRILEEVHDAKLVVTSNLRYGYTVSKIMKHWNLPWDNLQTLTLENDRTFEILAYLAFHTWTRFVILDDESIQKPLDKYWVQCDPDEGLTEERASRAIKILYAAD